MSNKANIYSIIFFVFRLLINILNVLPNNAQSEIEGKQINGAVKARNIVALKKLSSNGKKPATAVIATVQALGFMN